MLEIEISPQCGSPAADANCARAMQLQLAGRLDLAEPIYRTLLELEPAHGGANYGLGMLLVQSRRIAGGLPHLLTALNANPEMADYWLGYLEALLLLGERPRAISALALARHHGLAGPAADEFARRLETEPPATALKMIAAATRHDDSRDETASIRREEAVLLGVIAERRFAAALPLARRMTERHPGHGAAWKVFGAMLWAADSPAAALDAMHASVRLLPEDAEAHANLGSALTKLQRLDEAATCLRRALEIDPDMAAAHCQLGTNYQLQGQYAEAEKSFRRAIARWPQDFRPEAPNPRTNLLFVLNHDPLVDAVKLFSEHRRVGEYLEGTVPAAPPRHANRRDPDRPLQVAFVSADLREHAVVNFLEPVLNHWRHNEKLRLTVYYTNPVADDVSRRLRGLVSCWQDVFTSSDADLSQRIRDDGIDILIDLSGHTAFNRLRVFAHKPAPVQASWLGYPATTGLRAVDYYLTDRHFLPPGRFERFYTEKLVYLPVAWAFQPDTAAPPVNRLPALAAGHMTFGSFNRLGKINRATVALWSLLLRAVPDARMIIAGVPLELQHQRVIEWFAAEGIARARLAFHPYTTLAAHLALHHEVDIVLETTPYTGCTTTNHALWMGVPTLTLVGGTPASRLAAANLGHLGLGEFIAASPTDFAAKGLYWAGHLGELAQLRAGLRVRWQAAPAREPKIVADGIERALRQMWRRWCAGLAPESFEVPAEVTAEVPAEVTVAEPASVRASGV
jgi:predicted O-linked N-acetylglucosamine transferase (SPINDLY family)